MSGKYNDNYYFGGNRRKTLERDGWQCRICGMTNQEHHYWFKRNLTVDHIDGKGLFSKVKNNDMSNLWTLCLMCHGKKDRPRAAKRGKDKKPRVMLESALRQLTGRIYKTCYVCDPPVDIKTSGAWILHQRSDERNAEKRNHKHIWTPTTRYVAKMNKYRFVSLCYCGVFMHRKPNKAERLEIERRGKDEI